MHLFPQALAHERVFLAAVDGRALARSCYCPSLPCLRPKLEPPLVLEEWELLSE